MGRLFLDEWPLELRAAVVDFRLSLALRRVGRAVDGMMRKYQSDQPRAPKGTPLGGRWVPEAEGPGRRLSPHDRVLVAWQPMGFTKHGINQTINRGISASAIFDALNNPINVTPGSTPHSWKYRGVSAVVVLITFGEIITVWPI